MVKDNKEIKRQKIKSTKFIQIFGTEVQNIGVEMLPKERGKKLEVYNFNSKG